jgi:hypothetical protein
MVFFRQRGVVPALCALWQRYELRSMCYVLCCLFVRWAADSSVLFPGSTFQRGSVAALCVTCLCRVLRVCRCCVVKSWYSTAVLSAFANRVIEQPL